jgi:ribonuclease HIII
MPNSEIIELYNKIRSVLENKKITVGQFKLIDYGLQFDVSAPDLSGKIRIFQNKKNNIKMDYSQLKGNINQKIPDLLADFGNNSKDSSFIKDVEIPFPIIGTDESGKGDYFGPLVCAGVYVDEKTAKILVANGVKDSKELSDAKNLELANKIMEICRDQYTIIEISPERYNLLYDQFRKEQKNLNFLLAWCHAKAIEELLLKVDCEMAIIDQFADERIVNSKLQEKGRSLKIIQRHKAERNIAVAAASVLARAKYLTKLSKLSKQYQINLPKGASESTIQAAKLFIAKNGLDSLPRVAKIHFRITNQVLAK